MLLRDHKLKLPTPITAYILIITHFSHHFRNVTDINCGIVAKLFTLQSQKNINTCISLYVPHIKNISQ